MQFFLLEKTMEEITYKTEYVGGSSMNAFGQILFLIFIFGIVLFLAYYSTKFIAKNRIHSMNGKNISIIESINLGLGLSLYLVKTGTQYFLISVTKDKVELISEIDAQSIKEVEINDDASFEKIMKDCLGKFKQPKK